MAESNLAIVYATYPNEQAAQAAGQDLVVQRLAACVNIIPGMQSIYVWKGDLQLDQEVVLIAKTVEQNTGRAVAALREKHPYDVPAIIVIPVCDASPSFTKWVHAQTDAADAP